MSVKLQKISPPQYTQIPNILLDEWLPLLNSTELKVFLIVCRKTIGWHKKRDRIDMSQLVKISGSSVKRVYKAVKDLENKGLIKKSVCGKLGKQKSYYEVSFLTENSDIKEKNTPGQNARGPLVKTPDTKETKQKKTSSKEEVLTKEKKLVSPSQMVGIPPPPPKGGAESPEEIRKEFSGDVKSSARRTGIVKRRDPCDTLEERAGLEVRELKKKEKDEREGLFKDLSLTPTQVKNLLKLERSKEEISKAISLTQETKPDNFGGFLYRAIEGRWSIKPKTQKKKKNVSDIAPPEVDFDLIEKNKSKAKKLLKEKFKKANERNVIISCNNEYITIGKDKIEYNKTNFDELIINSLKKHDLL